MLQRLRRLTDNRRCLKTPNISDESVCRFGVKTQRTDFPDNIQRYIIFMIGHEFETPSGTITTISVSPSAQGGSIPTRSPVYCFHSFTYGVNGSNENVAELKDGEKAPAELDETAVSDSEDKSFDADSPNVWRTRTVVDPDDSASPTILCKWNIGESEECLSNGMFAVIH